MKSEAVRTWRLAPPPLVRESNFSILKRKAGCFCPDSRLFAVYEGR